MSASAHASTRCCWYHMIDRCRRPANDAYQHYGGRGIRVCRRWLKFENFLADMGPRPSAEHFIGRIDNNGPYSPKNCQWSTAAQQNRNSRANRLNWEKVARIRWLRFVSKLSYSQIASQMGIAVSHAKIRETKGRPQKRGSWFRVWSQAGYWQEPQDPDTH
jgi:hypothetical protein